MPGMDVYGLYVSDLISGTFNPSTLGEINRSWASGYYWPDGESAALSSADLQYILASDPFGSSSYQLPSPLPNTTPDGRFTIAGGAGGAASSFPYEQANNGNGAGITDLYSTATVNTSAQGASTNTNYKQSFALEEDIYLNLAVTLKSVFKETYTLSWGSTWQSTLTTSTTQTNNLSITGPNCPATSGACSPLYGGPAEFVLYQDNQYGTFMFAPTN